MNEEVTKAKSNYILFKADKPLAVFILFWFILNIIQIIFTELTSDEGYYWFYSQRLQWGYYDHPPAIALMIKSGAVVFPGELGVRIFNTVFSTAGLCLFFTLLPQEIKQTKKTFLVLLSSPLLHYLSFIVFPDGPLLFFTMVFLVTYKRFLVNQNFATALLLGLSLALMLFSKYQGALVLIFMLLANPTLFKSAYLYLILLVAAILFAPHLWWQYQNDFSTLKYHVFQRTGSISFKQVIEFLSQQILAIGIGLIFIPFFVKEKDVFERTLKFIILGTFLFFLIISFKTFVHFHWTSIALYPLLYFAVVYYNNPQKKKIFSCVVLPFIVLLFVVRILLIIPVIPVMHLGVDYYHGREKWAKEIAGVAGDNPVFMPDNLREASLYSFYSGNRGITLYSRQEKKSQYELWGYEDSLQNKNVLLVCKYPFGGSLPLHNNLQQNLNYTHLHTFSSYYNGVALNSVFIQQHNNNTIEVEIEIINNRSVPLNFSKGLIGEAASLVFSIENGGKIIKADVLEHLCVPVLPSATIKRKAVIVVNGIPAGVYLIYFGIRNGVLPDAILSERKLLKIVH